MKTLGVIANCSKPRAADVLARIGRLARQYGVRILTEALAGEMLPASEVCDLQEILDGSEVIMALGGDGTMLRTVRLIGERELPVVGVNIGSLGFLTSIAEDELDRAMECLANGEFTVRPVAVAHACVERRDGSKADFRALNDVVISRGASQRVVSLEVSIGGDMLTTYVCDGLIVSTPCGSTGHSLSAGGPILSPQTPALVLSVICPHTLSTRPLVVPDSSRIEVRAGKTNNPLTFAADGQTSMELGEGDRVSVTRSAHDACLVHLPDYSYFSVLRQKLHWSGSSIVEKKL